MKYFVMNKPRGCLTVRTDPDGNPTVYGHVPPHFPRLPHVGRLDFNSEGLLLFTDDGQLARALLEEDCEKVYEVKLRHVFQDDEPRIRRMEEPLVLEDGRETKPARVRVLKHRSTSTWVEVAIREGRHRQVRRLSARSDFVVRKLRRVRFGPLELGDLRIRWCRPLCEEEVAACYEAVLPGAERPPFEPIDDSPEAYARASSPNAPPCTAHGEPLEAIVFDLGRVLVDVDYQRGLFPLLHSAAQTSHAASEVYRQPIFKQLNRGDIGPEEFYRQLDAIHELGMDFDDFARAWCDVFHPMEEMERLVATLAQRFPLALLSDTDPLHWTHLRTRLDCVEHFRAIVLSYETGVMKPAQAAFEAATEALGVPAERCLFIDDRADNVRGARRAGMDAVRFRGLAALRRELAVRRLEV